MSNAQRRREHRHRGKTFPGPMTPADHAAARERAERLEQLYWLRRLAVAEQAEPTDAPAVPTSGPGRRRAKAARRTA